MNRRTVPFWGLSVIFAVMKRLFLFSVLLFPVAVAAQTTFPTERLEYVASAYAAREPKAVKAVETLRAIADEYIMMEPVSVVEKRFCRRAAILAII